MNKIEQIVVGLNTYRGRDACVRFACFLTLLVNSILKFLNFNDARIGFLLTMSKQFANCRVVLRVFEDLPAILNLYKFFTSKVN